MKKILVAAVVAFSSLAANAQIWMGGSLGFDYTDNDNSKAVTTFTISPEVGYTLDEKWDLGLAINANFPALIAVWIPNVVFSLVALYYYKKAPR